MVRRSKKSKEFFIESKTDVETEGEQILFLGFLIFGYD